MIFFPDLRISFSLHFFLLLFYRYFLTLFVFCYYLSVSHLSPVYTYRRLKITNRYTGPEVPFETEEKR